MKYSIHDSIQFIIQYIVHYVVEYSAQYSEQYIIKEAKRVEFLKELAKNFKVCVYYDLK